MWGCIFWAIDCGRELMGEHGMSVRTVVKIDLVGSKRFVGAREATNPNIRAVLLKKLLTISQAVFPQGETPLPHGSFYKSEGDAVYFI
jgi:hypothetical protein